MDRDLSPQQRHARLLRAGKPWAIAFIGAVALGILGLRQLTSSVARADLNIAVVEQGPIEAVISATGSVVPTLEQTVSSPLNAEVLKVLVSLGEVVKARQPIMELDRTAAALTLSNLEEELALKRQELRSGDLQLTDAIRESRSRHELLAVDLEAREVRLRRLQQLEGSGVASAQELLEARLDVKRTKIESEQVRKQIASLKARREAMLQSIQLTTSILEKKVADQSRRLALASVTAPRAGVITHLVNQQGISVAEGQLLATVAGQESFRVEASLSDFYAPQLKPGQRAKVQQASAEVMLGRLARIVPSGAGSQTILYIDLDNPSAPQLRANARVNVDIVTAEKPRGLRVRRGSSMKPTGVQHVYVLKGHSAIRTRVRTGLSSSQTIEVLDGLKVGDQVVVSDMSGYETAKVAVR